MKTACMGSFSYTILVQFGILSLTQAKATNSLGKSRIGALQ
jgi:hypothetical protein